MQWQASGPQQPGVQTQRSGCAPPLWQRRGVCVLRLRDRCHRQTGNGRGLEPLSIRGAGFAPERCRIGLGQRQQCHRSSPRGRVHSRTKGTAFCFPEETAATRGVQAAAGLQATTLPGSQAPVSAGGKAGALAPLEAGGSAPAAEEARGLVPVPLQQVSLAWAALAFVCLCYRPVQRRGPQRKPLAASSPLWRTLT